MTGGCSMKYEIRKSSDYMQYKTLFEAAGLEFNIDETGTKPEGFVTSFYCTDEFGQIIGASAIACKKSLYVINDIAVTENLRNQKIGEALLKRSMDYIINQGADSIYITARAPGFFKKYGFFNLKPSDVPDIFGCLSCAQYGKTCSPVFMKKDLRRSQAI